MAEAELPMILRRRRSKLDDFIRKQLRRAFGGEVVRVNAGGMPPGPPSIGDVRSGHFLCFLQEQIFGRGCSPKNVIFSNGPKIISE